MSFDVYAAIQEHAANHSATAAGDLHEEIWDAVLRRSDPRFHNARLTRDEGGVDGVAFLDPATGEARIYQAKFFEDLEEAEKPKKARKGAPAAAPPQATSGPAGHRGAVVDAFVRAHGNAFTCTSWVLLLPRALSQPDMSWLMGTMKTEAISEARRRKGLPAGADLRIAACAVEYLDGANLTALLAQQLDVAERHLPGSSLALMKQLEEERAARKMDRDDRTQLLLRQLRDEAIRSHQADTRRARVALGMVNQGWANLTGQLGLALVDEKVAATVPVVAGLIESHAVTCAPHAHACEGLVPGASALVNGIRYQSRVLQQTSTLRRLGMAEAESEAAIASRIIEAIANLQDLVGHVRPLFV
jgi:hypothetical protein